LILPSGRVFRRATIWDSVGKGHLHLADVVRKQILYELVLHRLAVCAVIGDTVLIEVPGAGDEETLLGQVREVVAPVLGEFLGGVPGGLRMRLVAEFSPEDH
jgi:hypothetical protein